KRKRKNFNRKPFRPYHCETTKNNQPSNSQFTPSKASRKNQKRYQPVTRVAQAESSLADSTTKEPPTPTPTLQTNSTPAPQTQSTSIITFSSPAPNHKPSLKRSRSSPILSSPSSTTANPFTENHPLFPPDTVPSLNSLPLPKPFDLNSLRTFTSSGARVPIEPSILMGELYLSGKTRL
ncbi:unnamed protein product, partial [Brassica rapa subsp. narinosa]